MSETGKKIENYKQQMGNGGTKQRNKRILKEIDSKIKVIKEEQTSIKSNELSVIKYLLIRNSIYEVLVFLILFLSGISFIMFLFSIKSYLLLIVFIVLMIGSLLFYKFKVNEINTLDIDSYAANLSHIEEIINQLKQDVISSENERFDAKSIKKNELNLFVIGDLPLYELKLTNLTLKKLFFIRDSKKIETIINGALIFLLLIILVWVVMKFFGLYFAIITLGSLV